MHDRDAAARLMDEVQRLYRERTGQRFTKVGLSELSGIGRPTLDNWLEAGVMPPVDGMTKLGLALRVPAAHLWMRWLDLGMTRSPLERIADALERAYPPVTYDGHLPDPEEAEALERADAAERSHHVPPADEGSEGPPAPHETTGSGRASSRP